MAGEPLFSADNAHAAGSGTPPHVRRDPGRYHGYFENRFGEQWVFVFDYAAGRGYLRGGDAGWDNVFVLPGDGTLPPDQLPVLNGEERRWLAACVRAAVRRKPG